MKAFVVPEPSERWTTAMAVSGQRHARVVGGDRRVVPLGDRAEEDVRRRWRCRAGACRRPATLKITTTAPRAVGMCRIFVPGLDGRDLFVLHRGVRGAEVDGLLGDRGDARARTVGLVVDLDVRVARPLNVWNQASYSGAGNVAPAPWRVTFAVGTGVASACSPPIRLRQRRIADPGPCWPRGRSSAGCHALARCRCRAGARCCGRATGAVDAPLLEHAAKHDVARTATAARRFMVWSRSLVDPPWSARGWDATDCRGTHRSRSLDAATMESCSQRAVGDPFPVR